MDKAEYRIRTDEIKELIREKEYGEAAAVADEIDWRRVKSVRMLCTVSDLYKINRRFDDAKNIMLIAYRKNPQSRTILYALCDLSIRLKELLDAIAYYRAYVQVAPKDSGRFVLQYRLYQAQEVGIGERIGVLEALKAEDYTERWGYELALLYHRDNQADKCVAECNELILWFGEGKYVTKAMELKMLHEPLTESQKYLYDHQGSRKASAGNPAEETGRPESPALLRRRAALREDELQDTMQEEIAQAPVQAIEPDAVQQYASRSVSDVRAVGEAEEISVKTVDVGNKYSTMNLQKELAESLRALLGEAKKPSATPETAGQGSFVEEDVLFEQKTEEAAGTDNEGFDTREILSLADIPRDKVVEIYRKPVVLQDQKEPAGAAGQAAQAAGTQPSESVEPVHIMEVQHPGQEQDTMVDMTRMEADGQISMVLPEPVRLEKQITGQLSIGDILAEWERRNQQIEKEHRDEIYERIKKQTGDIFAEFDARKRADILDELNDLADRKEGRIGVQEETELPYEEAQPVQEDGGVTYEEEPPLQEEELPYAQDVYPQAQEEFTLGEDTAPQEEEQVVYEEEPLPPQKADFTFAEEEALLPGESEFAYSESEVRPDEPEEYDAPAYRGNKPAETAVQPQARASLSFRDKVPEKYRRYVHSDEGMKEIQTAVREADLSIGSGNIVVEGDNFDYCFDFIKQLLSDLRDKGMRLSGKLARISAVNLNRKKAVQIISSLENGVMVIERISMLNADKMRDIQSALREDGRNLLLILVDTPDAIRTLCARRPDFMEYFPIRVSMQGMSTKELVRYGSAYAYSEEYVIDEMALLALQTRIEVEEAGDRVPMPEDVEEMVNAAIRHVNRIGMRKFRTTLSGSRYNEDDMVILKEQDFA